VKAAGLGKDIIIFYDFEYDTVKSAKNKKVYLTKTNCIEFTNAFCDYVKSKGYKAGFYLNQDYYKNWYDAATIKKYIIWLADYNPEPHFPCIYQQYTSKGKVNGIPGNVDMNYFYD
jgi:GH25 family lysozyme M1 (1,4-beta-N-acetylmuramidase)